MTEDKSVERVRMTVSVSPKNHLSSIEWEKWRNNLLEFAAPFLVVLFTQLALGVEPKVAFLIALPTFWGACRDLFKKWQQPTITA